VLDPEDAMSSYRDSPALVERLAQLEEENATLRAAATEVAALRKEVAALRGQLRRGLPIELVGIVVAAIAAAGILAGFSIAHGH
jgi:hypothetical protein